MSNSRVKCSVPSTTDKKKWKQPSNLINWFPNFDSGFHFYLFQIQYGCHLHPISSPHWKSNISIFNAVCHYFTLKVNKWKLIWLRISHFMKQSDNLTRWVCPIFFSFKRFTKPLFLVIGEMLYYIISYKLFIQYCASIA